MSVEVGGFGVGGRSLRPVHVGRVADGKGWWGRGRWGRSGCVDFVMVVGDGDRCLDGWLRLCACVDVVVGERMFCLDAVVVAVGRCWWGRGGWVRLGCVDVVMVVGDVFRCFDGWVSFFPLQTLLLENARCAEMALSFNGGCGDMGEDFVVRKMSRSVFGDEMQQRDVERD